MHICNALQKEHGLATNPPVSVIWLVKKHRRERIQVSVCFFIYLFAWKLYAFTLSLVYLFHLDTWEWVSFLAPYIMNFNSYIVSLPNTWWDFRCSKADPSMKAYTSGKTRWLVGLLLLSRT